MPKRSMCVVLLGLLAGCSYQHGPGSTDLIDGSYRGRPQLTAANPDLCGTTHYGFIELGDRELHFAYVPTVIFDAAVQPDGSVHDKVGPATLDGKVVGDRMIFSVVTPACRADYDLGFLWNHS